MAGWLRRQKFRVRLSALVAAAVGVTVALASLAAYVSVHHQLYSQVDTSLNGEVGLLASPQGEFRPGQEANFLRRYNNSLLQIIDPTSNVEYFSAPLGSPPLPINHADVALAAAGAGAGPTFRNITYQGQSYRLLTVGADVESPAATAAIQIAVPLTDIEHSLRDLRLILWLVTIAGVVVGVGLGYLVGRSTIRPVERLTAAAEHVAATQDLESTIDERGEDELARLARSFNAMLRALAASRQQQAQLISDAGHELRTPLTSLRTNIEVLMRVRELPEDDRADLLTDVQAQLEEMTTLVGDLVDLAREDEGQVDPIEVRFDPIVERAVERARRRAPSVVFDLAVVSGSVRAQPALLERAVLNVLDNAAKWSPPGGTVLVRLGREDTWKLDVLDQGPGISAEDLPHVFERFYRAATARALPGSGLGLAIVQRIVADHGGTVTATSPSAGGTLLHIELPIVAEHEPDPAEAGPVWALDAGSASPYGPPATSWIPALPVDDPPAGGADSAPASTPAPSLGGGTGAAEDRQGETPSSVRPGASM